MHAFVRPFVGVQRGGPCTCVVVDEARVVHLSNTTTIHASLSLSLFLSHFLSHALSSLVITLSGVRVYG